MLPSANTTPTARDSYGSATLVNASERQRMNIQFALHTAPLLGRAMTSRGSSQGLKLLDVGSGYGAVLSVLGHPHVMPARLALMDPNPQLLAQARARAVQAGVDPATCAGAIDLQQVPIALRDNDVVLCSFTATHVSDLDSAVAHMAGALRPGGMLVLTDVDYCASMAYGDDAAQDCLWQIQQKLVVRELSAVLPRLALRHGLHPAPSIGCSDALHSYVGGDASRDMELAFVGNFRDDDPARLSWHGIGPNATVVLRRLAHLYVRG